MSIFFGILIAIHLVLCLVLIVLVLLQNDKAGGIGAGMGGLGGGAAFSSGGAATFITRLTTGVAISFMAVILTLNVLVAQRDQGDRQPAAAASAAVKGLEAVPTQLPAK